MQRSSSTQATKPAKSGPPEKPPTDSIPYRQRYQMAATEVGVKPGKVGPLGK